MYGYDAFCETYQPEPTHCGPIGCLVLKTDCTTRLSRAVDLWGPERSA